MQSIDSLLVCFLSLKNIFECANEEFIAHIKCRLALRALKVIDYLIVTVDVINLNRSLSRPLILVNLLCILNLSKICELARNCFIIVYMQLRVDIIAIVNEENQENEQYHIDYECNGS